VIGVQSRVGTAGARGSRRARRRVSPPSRRPRPARPVRYCHQTCPHPAVHGPHDESLAVWTAVMVQAIRRSWPETSSEGRRRLDRSPPTRSHTRPPPVSSGAAWPVWDSGPLRSVPLSPSTRKRLL
jgi:hypothetical protein